MPEDAMPEVAAVGGSTCSSEPPPAPAEVSAVVKQTAAEFAVAAMTSATNGTPNAALDESLAGFEPDDLAAGAADLADESFAGFGEMSRVIAEDGGEEVLGSPGGGAAAGSPDEATVGSPDAATAGSPDAADDAGGATATISSASTPVASVALPQSTTAMPTQQNAFGPRKIGDNGQAGSLFALVGVRECAHACVCACMAACVPPPASHPHTA